VYPSHILGWFRSVQFGIHQLEDARRRIEENPLLWTAFLEMVKERLLVEVQAQPNLGFLAIPGIANQRKNRVFDLGNFCAFELYASTSGDITIN
jgi:hypothetical protein